MKNHGKRKVMGSQGSSYRAGCRMHYVWCHEGRAAGGIKESDKHLSPVHWNRLEGMRTNEEDETWNKKRIYPAGSGSAAERLCHRIPKWQDLYWKVKNVLRACP